MILTSHIKDGIELAREYGLREDVIQFTSQHHGTSMIRYFYFKALKEGKTSEQHMNDFRYDTELPTSKETALVMLADSVQAASTSLDDPAELEAMIHNVIRIPLEDGQLDESPLTLRDLELIEKSFFKTLRAMRHDRSGSFPKDEKIAQSSEHSQRSQQNPPQSTRENSHSHESGEAEPSELSSSERNNPRSLI